MTVFHNVLIFYENLYFMIYLFIIEKSESSEK